MKTFIRSTVTTLALLMMSALSLSAQAIPTLDQILSGAPAVSDTGQELFSVSDTDGADDDVTTFILGRSASFSNAFGIYDPNNIANRLEVSGGSVPAGFSSGAVLEWDFTTLTYSLAGTASTFATTASNSIFGLYIDTGSNIWYSQTGLNSDGFDHLLTFDTEGLGGVTNGFDIVFAWEDLPGGGDMDWNDIVLGCIDCTDLVNTNQVPVAATMPLMGIGAIALLWSRRRKICSPSL